MYKIVLVLIISLFMYLPLLGQSETTIAVLDLEALGIDPSETSVLSNRLRTLLVNLNGYKVVERSRMEEILNEQGLQQSGCTSDECVIEVGKLLGVQKMLAGSFGKFGNIYTLELRIIDVQTAKIESSTNYDYRSEIENLLLEGVETALRTLLLKTDSGKLSKNQKGSLKIITNPPGASVLVNSTSYKATPVLINSINSGVHDIIIEKSGYVSHHEKIRVVADSVNQFVIDLKSRYAFLEIKSLVQGAELFINYQSVGKNLFRGERLEPGTYYIELKHDFYNNYTEEFEIKAGERIFKEIDLAPAVGQLLINTKPRSISLFLQKGEDKKNFLISRKENLPMTAGYYDMELTATSYYPYKDKIKIIGDEILPLEIELQYGGDDLRKLKNQRKWLNLSSTVGLGLSAVSLLLANQMYSNYENANNSSDAESYKTKTQTYTYITYGLSAITFGISLSSIWKWYKIRKLKVKLGLK